jgi:hypothetical protein
MALQSKVTVLITPPMAAAYNNDSGSGCLRAISFLILLAFASGLGYAMFYIAQPQDLSDIGGREGIQNGSKPRNLNLVLKNAHERGHALTISEADINLWLSKTLVPKQGGPLATKVTLNQVWVRLNDGYAEVIMERSILGKPFTVSMFLKVEQTEGEQGIRTEIHRHGGPFHADAPKLMRGGRFGKLVVPQGFLVLVMPAYSKLSETYAEEIRLAFEEMSRIRIESGRLLLDSGEPMDVPRTQ